MKYADDTGRRNYTRGIDQQLDRKTFAPRAVRGVRAIALALALGGVLAAPAAAQTSGQGPPAPVAKVDRDRDRVSDDLERRLDSPGASDAVDVIVTLGDSASADRVGRIERGVGGFALRKRFRAVDGFAARVTERQVAGLARRPGVVGVERDAPVRALNDSSQSAFGVTQARIDNPSLDGGRDAKPARYSRKDMVAAVIDTGISPVHRDLDEGKILGFANCASGTCRVRAPFDDSGHGTHIAGTLAGDGDGRTDGRYRGVAPAAGLVGVKVLDANGQGSESAVIAGIDWTIANRVRYGIEAVNVSIGSDYCSDGTDAMARAANRAVAAGLVVTAAAGNSGPEPCTIESPAAASGVIAVGTMADVTAGGFFEHLSSSRGIPGGRIKPDVMAPGEKVTSAARGTSTGYVTKSGTSSAAPFVAGVALLMRDASPSLSATKIRKRIKWTAVDWGLGGRNITLGSRGPDSDFGWGRLDAYNAIIAAGANGLTSPPPVPAHRLLEAKLAGGGAAREFPLDIVDRCVPIAAGLVVPGWASPTRGDDFDVELTDPDGNVVDAAATAERQETVSYKPPRTGRYTLRVVSYRGRGPFFADVSAGLTPPPPGAPAYCAPQP